MLELSRVLSPFPPLVSPRFFFLREFCSRVLPSERLEQANIFENLVSNLTLTRKKRKISELDKRNE